MFGLRKYSRVFVLCIALSLKTVQSILCISRTVPVFEANGLFIQIRYSRIADFSGHA
jgi:hypothetical protein